MIMENRIAAIRETIVDKLLNTKKDGISRMVYWLEASDFFTAPASTKHHYAFEGGLALHSLSVRNTMHKLNMCFDSPILEDSIEIVSLLHDVCKANYYVRKPKKYFDPIKQNREPVEYEVKDQLPIGHGEKSLYIVGRHLDLNTAEECAIRYHMGAWTPGVVQDPRSFNEAAEYPLVTLMIAADNISSRMLEKK